MQWPQIEAVVCNFAEVGRGEGLTSKRAKQHGMGLLHVCHRGAVIVLWVRQRHLGLRFAVLAECSFVFRDATKSLLQLSGYLCLSLAPVQEMQKPRVILPVSRHCHACFLLQRWKRMLSWKLMHSSRSYDSNPVLLGVCNFVAALDIGGG